LALAELALRVGDKTADRCACSCACAQTRVVHDLYDAQSIGQLDKRAKAEGITLHAALREASIQWVGRRNCHAHLAITISDNCNPFSRSNCQGEFQAIA